MQLQISELYKKIPSSPNEAKVCLAKKEDEIQELQSKLTQAIIEIEKSTNILEKLAEEKNKICTHEEESVVITDLKSRLQTAHERCQELQSQVTVTEQDAQNQGQQVISEILIILVF